MNKFQKQKGIAMSYIKDFSEISINDIQDVGGKNASLGEMITKLSHLNVKVPPGFATTSKAYQDFLHQNGLQKKMDARLADLDVEDVNKLAEVGKDIRQWIIDASLPKTVEDEIRAAYRKFNLKPQQSFAVRSSATAEDLVGASFAGQQETYLNIVGEDAVLHAIKKVFASLFTDRAIAYRVQKGFNHADVSISAGIQQMIRSDLAASGVMFTMDTESGFDQVVFITASYGLGEAIVQGTVNPDEFYVHKPTFRKGKRSIICRKPGSKLVKLIYTDGSSEQASIKQVDVPDVDQKNFCLNDDEILELVRQALIIEDHYKKPMDIEWAKDGVDQQLYIIQARPETVKAQENHQIIEQYRLNEKGKLIVAGRSVGQKIARGVARQLDSPKQMDRLKPGEILVTDMTDPDWEPIMKRAAAIVTNRGGRTCHAAIIARELGIPAVVGCGNATAMVQDDQEVTVSCAEGETGNIYEGLLKYELEKTAVNELPDISVNLCMNVANPEQAFACQFLPNNGVGLARLEFIIGNMIGIHPNALLQFDQMSSELKDEITKRIAGYANPVEFYISKLAEGIATIAAAFYPKKVIVRFSDFKSNEYANLLGGIPFEAKEENPMLGYRGASRYVSGNFRDCFLLECEAIKRVRNIKGLDNTQVMFPFVRTVNEAKNLTALLKSQGLERGKDGLQVYMMCEIPSNVILAEEFLPYFDGFSIGSNDLTQLTLGLDRDSELVADLFDERNSAVKALLHQAISVCKKMNKYVGICGQGPSDHLDFAEWLMEEGINSISLSPDSIVQTWLALGKQGDRNGK